MWLKLEYWSKGNDLMKLVERVLLVAIAILVVHNLHGKVFPAKAMNGYEDSLAIMWEVLDADKDGGISVSELKAADADSDDSLSVDELLDYTNKHIDNAEADLQQDDANIEGTYEIYPPTFDEIPPSPTNGHDKFILELTKADDDEYLVKLSRDEHSVNGTEVKVSGKKCTFETSVMDGSIKSFQSWECIINNGEISVELTMTQETFSLEPFKGKLLVEADLQQDEANIEGAYELYPPHANIQDSKPVLELTEHGDGEYSVKLTHEDQFVNGTEVRVNGNKCTFMVNISETVFQSWECTVTDGELSVESTQLVVATVPPLKLNGKLLAEE